MSEDKLAMARIDQFNISRRELAEKRENTPYGHLIQ